MSLLDWIIPPFCAHCMSLGSWLCPLCTHHLSATEVSQKLRVFPSLRKVVSGFRYDGPAQSLVKSVKYDGAFAYIPTMAKLLDLRLRKTVQHWNLDGLVPIPLHPHRQQWRGFNQAELLAKELSTLWNIPVLQALERPTWKKTQATSNRRERQRLKHDFRWTGLDIAQKRLALIDDVVTTGGTLSACARELSKGDPAWIAAITFAQA